MKNRNNKYRILFITQMVLCFAIMPAQSQELKKRALRINIGFNHYQNRDDLGSPLKYQGNESIFSILYHNTNTHRKHHYQIAFAKGSPKPQSTSKSMTHTFGNLQYGYHRLITSQNNIAVWTGGIWNNAFSFRNYHYTRNNGEVTYEIHASFNISTLAELRLNTKNKVTLGSYLPLLTYISRSPYALRDETFLDDVIQGNSILFSLLKNGKLTSLHQFLKFDFYLFYQYAITPPLTIGMQYQWSYDRYPKPQTTSTLSNQLTLAFTYKFKNE